MDEINPYAAPRESPQWHSDELPFVQNHKDEKKIQYVIQDSRYVLLAIFFSCGCGLLGFVFPLWCAIRLYQWRWLARKYPQLLDGDADQNDLPDRFRKARSKLGVGLVVGCIVFLGMVLSVIRIG